LLITFRVKSWTPETISSAPIKQSPCFRFKVFQDLWNILQDIWF
jgi:hypothetical protein